MVTQGMCVACCPVVAIASIGQQMHCGQGKLKELVEAVTKQTLAYKLGMLEQALQQA